MICVARAFCITSRPHRCIDHCPTICCGRARVSAYTVATHAAGLCASSRTDGGIGFCRRRLGLVGAAVAPCSLGLWGGLAASARAARGV
jgi:hypothetical protein